MSQSPLLKMWQQYQQKVDALKARERALVLLMVMAVIYMFWDFVIFNPLAVAKSTVDKQVIAVEQKISAMKQEEKAILLAVNSDPDRDIKQKIQAAEGKLDELNNSLEELSLGLIPVEELATVLRDVLKSTQSLELLSLRTLPVEAMAVGESASPEGDNENAGVYKHRVALKLKGNFRELRQYLVALESLNWRFYWDELHFEEHAYPDAVINLNVYTLSTDEGLFGV